MAVSTKVHIVKMRIYYGTEQDKIGKTYGDLQEDADAAKIRSVADDLGELSKRAVYAVRKIQETDIMEG